MTKFKRLTSLVLTLCLVCCMTVSASADSTIDPGRTGSLTLYKYDLTSAEADGAWDSSAYVATGESDQGVIDALAGYAVPGVEFSCIKLAEAESANTQKPIKQLCSHFLPESAAVLDSMAHLCCCPAFHSHTLFTQSAGSEESKATSQRRKTTEQAT